MGQESDLSEWKIKMPLDKSYHLPGFAYESYGVVESFELNTFNDKVQL